MFKQATIFRIISPMVSAAQAEEAAQAFSFAPCGATQEKSIGWTPPRGQEHGALVEVVNGQIIMKLMIETKAVPSDVLKRKVDEQCEIIEQQTGRKPGKKERREISDDARIALLPAAFSKITSTMVWIGPGLIVVDSASSGRVDDVIHALVKTIDGIAMQLLHTQTSPSSAMAQWLVEMEAPAGFTVDRECELKACDESKAVVRYTRHALDTDEVIQHITHGKMPTKLAMTFDDRISFILTEAMALKKLDLLDVLFEESTESVDAFDADVAIFTGEMLRLIQDLIPALGGEVNVTQGDTQ